MEKEISKSFIDELKNKKLSPEDIGKIFSYLLSSNLSDLKKFSSVKEYLDPQISLEFEKGENIENIKTIECYLASFILKNIEKGSSDILNILIQTKDETDKDLYKLMERALK